MLILATRDRSWILQVNATLASQGIPARWIAAPGQRELHLEVEEIDAEAASLLISVLRSEEEEASPPPTPAEARSDDGLLLAPGFAFSLGLAALTVAFHWVTGPADAGGRWFRTGALFERAVQDGEWWRLVTAATLHADAEHAAANAVFFIALGWAVSERLGWGLAAFAWLATAVAAFGGSLLYGSAAVTVGASGGLFGLLGVAAGHATRRRPRLGWGSFHTWRALGAGVLLLAFTAFSPRANLAAHLTGFAVGLLLGLVAPRRPLGLLWQGLFLGLTVATVWGSWWWAMR